MFFGANEFFDMLRGYRVCAIRGRYGSGKTLLGVALAIEAWRRGWCDHIYSNLCLLGDFYEDIPEFIRSAFVIYDEAWQTLDARSFSAKGAQRWLGYLRKRNVFLVLPSVLNVDVRFRVLMVQRSLTLGPLWGYRWQVDDGFKPFGGWMWLMYPLRVGQAYNHLEEPSFERGEALALALSRNVPVMGEVPLTPDVPVRFVEDDKGGKKSGRDVTLSSVILGE